MTDPAPTTKPVVKKKTAIKKKAAKKRAPAKKAAAKIKTEQKLPITIDDLINAKPHVLLPMVKVAKKVATASVNPIGLTPEEHAQQMLNRLKGKHPDPKPLKSACFINRIFELPPYLSGCQTGAIFGVGYAIHADTHFGGNMLQTICDIDDLDKWQQIIEPMFEGVMPASKTHQSWLTAALSEKSMQFIKILKFVQKQADYSLVSKALKNTPTAFIKEFMPPELYEKASPSDSVTWLQAIKKASLIKELQTTMFGTQYDQGVNIALRGRAAVSPVLMFLQDSHQKVKAERRWCPAKLLATTGECYTHSYFHIFKSRVCGDGSMQYNMADLAVAEKLSRFATARGKLAQPQPEWALVTKQKPNWSLPCRLIIA